MPFAMCCSGLGLWAKKDRDDFEEYAMDKLQAMLSENVTKLSEAEPMEAEESTKLARLIYNSMTTSGRVYHSMMHVFDISQTMNGPILILSALFHDVIYYQIDKTFDQAQIEALEGLLVPDSEPLKLRPSFDDTLINSIIELYGLEPGSELPKSGTNEFLSAIIGGRLLQKWLSQEHLIQIATCIEATIPFRPVIDGKTPMDRLYDRLAAVASEKSESWLVETVRMAAATANCDLCSFDSNDRDFFLDSSWKLIPEGRPILLEEDCPLMEFLLECYALMGRSFFLQGAVPKIFQSFRQVPSASEMEDKQRKTRDNLSLVIVYGEVRLLQMMCLVAFSKAVGEDPLTVPLRPYLTLEVLETTKANTTLTSTERQIRHWLVSGRRASFDWDPASSSLGRYLFDTLGTKGISEAVEAGKSHEKGSTEILNHLPKTVVEAIGSSLAKHFPEKEESYLQVSKKFGASN